MKKISILSYLILFVFSAFGQSSDAALTTQMNQIKNETAPKANNATRIGNALNALVLSKININQKGVANGVGSLDGSGLLPVSQGGTDIGSYTVGDILVASATGTLSKLGIGTSGYILTSRGPGLTPTWQVASSGVADPGGNGIMYRTASNTTRPAVAGTDYQAPLGYTAENSANKGAASGYAGLNSSGYVPAAQLGTGTASANTLLHGNNSYSKADLTADVINALPAANGGTGIASYTIGDIPYASASTTLGKVSPGTAGYALISNGAATAPSYQAISISAPTYAALTDAATINIDATSSARTNKEWTSSRTAVTLTFSNLVSGSSGNINFFKTTASDLTLTLPAGITIMNEGVPANSGTTTTLTSTTSGNFSLYWEKVGAGSQMYFFVKRIVD